MSHNRLLLLLFSGAIAASSVCYGFIGKKRDVDTEIIPGNSVLSQISTETKDAFRLYRDADQALQQDDVTTMLRSIDQARCYRLSVTRLQNTSAPGENISSTALLLRLAKGVARHAETAAKRGDRAQALSFVRAVRSLSEHVMETALPTMEALQTGRALDQINGRVEVTVMEHLGETALARRASAREQALREFYTTHMMPSIITATRQRERLIGVPDADSQQRELDRNDAVLAVVLLGQYSRERLRLLHNRS
jgi:hypothetical protein